jgi:hypothetical protein
MLAQYAIALVLGAAFGSVVGRASAWLECVLRGRRQLLSILLQFLLAFAGLGLMLLIVFAMARIGGPARAYHAMWSAIAGSLGMVLVGLVEQGRSAKRYRSRGS